MYKQCTVWRDFSFVSQFQWSPQMLGADAGANADVPREVSVSS